MVVNFFMIKMVDAVVIFFMIKMVVIFFMIKMVEAVVIFFMIKMVETVVMMVAFCLFPDTAHPTCKTMITPVHRAQKPPKADVLSARARSTLEYNQPSPN